MAIKYGIKEVADVTFYDLTTNKPLLFLDTLKVTSIENKADSSYARGGKGNPKLLGWDFNREATMKVQDALMSLKSISLMTGNGITTGAKNVFKRELIATVVGTTGKSKVTLAKAPLVGTVTVLKADGTEPTTAPTISGSDVSFVDTEVAVGALVEVFYQFASAPTTETITISADKFPSYVKLVGDTVIRNASTGADEAFQMVIWKAKIMPTFTLTFQADGDPTVFDMDMDIFRRDIDTEMIELVKYN
jgi:hypothetical protein